MKRLAFLLLSLWLALTAAQALAATQADPFVTDLIAGNPKNNGKDIGDVLVWDDGTNLFIKLLIPDSSPWALGETHVAVASSYKGLPQTKKGNAIPGLFPFKTVHNPFVEAYTYKIPLPGYDPLYIAVQAEAHTGSPNDLVLPCAVTLTLTPPIPDILTGHSYFNVTLSGYTSLDGSYHGWCASTDNYISFAEYGARVFSSTGSVPSCLFSAAADWDAINWILNHISPPTEKYNWAEVQTAIWKLLGEALPGSDDFPLFNDPNFSMGDVDALVAEAIAKEPDFVPGCGDVVAVILVPGISDCALNVCDNLCMIKQPILIPIPVPCNGEETAWAEGPGFKGKDWSMYFTYSLNGSDAAPAPASMGLTGFSH